MEQTVPLHLHEASTLLPHPSVSHSEYNNCHTHSHWEGKCLISLKVVELSAYNDSSFFFPSLTSSATHIRCKGLLLNLITLNGTHKHSVGFPCTRERPVVEVSLYVTIHNTHERQTTMPLAGFEPSFSAIERPHTYAIDWNDPTTQICLVDDSVNLIGWPVE
jgi:hypothetical protein